MAGKSALLIGATGLVGGLVLQRLLDCPEYDRVIAVSRRPVAVKSPRLVNVEVSFDDLAKVSRRLKGVDAFCCLGTTLEKAGSRAEFHKIDYGYALEFADIVRKNGTKHFLLLTAVGANKRSPVFYNRVKGLLEHDVATLDFPSLSIFRPSLLLGGREERRPMEQLVGTAGRLIAPVMIGPASRYRPISAGMVAAAMVNVALAAHHAPQPGQRVYHYAEMMSAVV